MPVKPTPDEIARAADLLRGGRLVVFPTETVYGLGANALDVEAVSRIYSVKRRPPTSPLIVHVESIEMARSLAAAWPERAQQLTEKFWPGPLTIVVEKQPVVPDIVTAGLSTVGLRMPAHPVALALIRAAQIPLAAPSANRFTELSPTTGEHVQRSLGKDVDLILDGGPCQVGIESTVVSLAGARPVLLRPGGISRAQIEKIIGPVATAEEVFGQEVTPGASDGVAHPSPGMHARHYSPHTPLFLVRDGKVPAQGKGICLQRTHQASPTRMTSPDVTTIQMPANPSDYATALYDQLHRADEANVDWIAVDEPPATAEWEAVNDRLRRAATRE